MSLRDYLTNQEKEEDGVWFIFPGFKVKAARMSRRNAKFARFMKKYRKSMDNAKSDAEAEMRTREALAKTIILGWETEVDGEFVPGIERLDGGKGLLPFNTENVLKTLEALPDLASEIIDQATSRENYLVEEDEDDLEEDAKN